MEPPFLLSPATTFQPRGHSRSPSRSPTRPRITDDFLSDLSPATTLEAFTSASGTLRTSIEAATPAQRSFGIRAAIVSQKLQEWVEELSAWQWPEGRSEGFEKPKAKRRKLSIGDHDHIDSTFSKSRRHHDSSTQADEYWGSLPARVVVQYESRIYEIEEDMEDLDVEEIKGQVLNTHLSSSPVTTSTEDQDARISSKTYARMDDFTAVVTATVLQALPALSRLMTLMDLWSVRLNILRDVPPLMLALDHTEIALKSGWAAIESTVNTTNSFQNMAGNRSTTNTSLSRSRFDIIRDALQEKVTDLGRRIDHMLDTLEGRQDTIPEAWLDRMEKIEHDYGEWVVCGDRKVREGEWAAALAERRRLQEQNFSAVPSDVVPKVAGAEKMQDSVLKSDDNSVGNVHEAPKLHTAQLLQDGEPALESIPPLLDTPKSMVSVSSTVPTAITSSGNLAKNESKRESEKGVTTRNIEATSVELADHPPLTEVVAGFPQLYEAIPDPQHDAYWLKGSSSPIDAVESATVSYGSCHQGFEGIELENEPSVVPEKSTSPLTTSRTATIGSTELAENVNARVESVEDQTAVEDNAIEHSILQYPLEVYGLPNQDHVSLMTAPPAPGELPAATDARINDMAQTKVVDVFVEPHIMSQPDSILMRNQKFDGMCELSSMDRTRVDEIEESITTSVPHESSRTMPEELSLQRNELQSTSSSRSRPSTPLRPSSSDSQRGSAINSPVKDHNTQTSSDRAQRGRISLPKFGSGLANGLRLSILPNSSTNNTKAILQSQELRPPNDSTKTVTEINLRATQATDPVVSSTLVPRQDTTDAERKSTSPKLTLKLPAGTLKPDTELATFGKGHSRVISNSSTVSGYATSDPSPEIYEAEPAEYFKPVLSPAKSESSGSDPSTTTPTRSHGSLEALPSPLTLPPLSPSENESRFATPNDGTSILSGGDPSSPSSESAGGSSTPIKIVRIHRRVSTSSSISTVMHLRSTSAVGSPIELPSPVITSITTGAELPLHPYSKERSSPLERIRIYDEEDDLGLPNSPTPAVIKKRIVIPDAVPLTDTPTSGSPTSPRDAPLLENVDVLTAPLIQDAPKSSEDQLQQQISEILETIPAHIRLTSEPETERSIGSLQVKKRGSSATTRPMSGATTPSFILAPAYSKGTRQRQQNGSPEIKLYHLSRNTGEAPIKLFVRLVGESGERVMVRVGGGWADLSEYLREYASHHSRRSDVAGKVEIQDLPPRVASNNRNGSGSTGHSSPISRPVSSLDRPMPNLGILQNRASVGEEPRLRDQRSPSTPNALTSTMLLQQQSTTTPPSAPQLLSRSPDDAAPELGLAGPKGRKAEGISAENAAWVERMKENVRQASAEKDKERERDGRKGGEFGALGRAGATKRLFKRRSGAFGGFGGS